MATSVQIKLVSALIICIMMSAPLATEAITCGQVASGVSGCMGYLKGSVRGAPPSGCCNGIRGLAGAAKTAADKKNRLQLPKIIGRRDSGSQLWTCRWSSR
nr:LTP3 [Colobanthus quitensis]